MSKKHGFLAILAITAALLVFTSVPGRGEGLNWLTSYEKALEAAAKEDKMIIANFTGSDWCQWCFKIRDEIFSTDRFKQWSAENVVLLEIDFPRKKELPADLKKQNENLAQKYQIQGFPTILILDGKGEVIGKTGYIKGGADPWIKSVKSTIREMKTDLAESLGAAVRLGKEISRPVLVLAANSGSAREKAVLKKVIDNSDINALSKTALIVVQVNLPLPSNSEGLLMTKLNPKMGEASALLFNPSEDTVLLNQEITADGIPALLSAVRAKLPKPKYQGGWIENYAEARYAAAVTGKPLFLNFTGSDWCSWCFKLEGEIFSKPEFEKYADENLILVKLDFPKKRKLSPAVVGQNKELAVKYGVRGFPTLIIVNPAGNKIGQAGYMKGGPEPFIKNLQKIIK